MKPISLKASEGGEGLVLLYRDGREEILKVDYRKMYSIHLQFLITKTSGYSKFIRFKKEDFIKEES